MSWPANETAERRWLFLLELDLGTEAVLRALSPFPGQGAEVSRLELETRNGRARLAVEAGGLDHDRAALLQRRLAQVAAVRSVTAGWR